MKLNLFVLIFFCCLISLNANAEVKSNPIHLKKQNKELLKYQGDKYISSKDFAKKIDVTCRITSQYYESNQTQKEIDAERKKCILSKITFDYETTIDNMKLNEKVYLPPVNNINMFLKKTKTESSPIDLDVEVKLFTEVDNKIIDEISLYFLKYYINDYTAEIQYYFINNYINILRIIILEEGKSVHFWKKYAINSNGKLNLVDSFRCHYELDKNICH